jgi:hypothetical protein
VNKSHSRHETKKVGRLQKPAKGKSPGLSESLIRCTCHGAHAMLHNKRLNHIKSKKKSNIRTNRLLIFPPAPLVINLRPVGSPSWRGFYMDHGRGQQLGGPIYKASYSTVRIRHVIGV